MLSMGIKLKPSNQANTLVNVLSFTIYIDQVFFLESQQYIKEPKTGKDNTRQGISPQLNKLLKRGRDPKRKTKAN